MKNCKCEITAFLSLVFILLVSFVFGILEVSVIQISKNMSRLETDRAVYSVFGEYQRELLEKYHVFAIEGSYGTGSFDETNVIQRMHYFGTEMTEHEIIGIQYLTDNGGQAFREQVVQYMEQRYGLSLVKDFTGLTEEWEKQEIQGEEMEKEEKNAAEEIDEFLKNTENPENSNIGEEQNQGLKNDENPFACIQEIEKSGVLSLVMPKDMTLSGKEINLDNQASYRNLITGRGSFPARTGMDNIEERLLFNEYILENFTNASQKAEDRKAEGNKKRDIKQKEGIQKQSLNYEVEYILSGKKSDKENLEAVADKIFLIRMGLNYAFLQGNTAKQAEAQTLAVTISTLLLMPEASEAVKQLILLAWAAGESVVDVRGLLSGKRIALVKDSQNWQLSLSSLLKLAAGGVDLEGNDTPDGISYNDYLRMLLFLENTDSMTMRTLDRIEENLMKVEEKEYFKVDQCITKIEMSNMIKIYGNLTYQFPVYFAYQ